MFPIQDTHELTDVDLVASARTGDRDAFAALVDRHYGQLLRHLTYRTGNADLAGDLAQDTILEAFRHLDRLAKNDVFPAWLRGIARNRLRMTARRQRLRWTVSLEEISSPVALTIPALQQRDDSEPCVERDLLQRVIAELSPPLKEALLLCVLGELTASQVASVLQISRAAAERRISRAKEQFRALYVALDSNALGNVAPVQDIADSKS